MGKQSVFKQRSQSLTQDIWNTNNTHLWWLCCQVGLLNDDWPQDNDAINAIHKYSPCNSPEREEVNEVETAESSP